MSKHDPNPLMEWCVICGWRKGGQDSWNGKTCKCGFESSQVMRHAHVESTTTHYGTKKEPHEN